MTVKVDRPRDSSMKKNKAAAVTAVAILVLAFLAGFIVRSTTSGGSAENDKTVAVDLGAQLEERGEEAAESEGDAGPHEEAAAIPYQIFNIDAALTHARQLSINIGYRPGGTSAEHKAAEYIRGAFSSVGYERVYEQTFALENGLLSSNIYVVDEGSDPNSLIIVGGHYDSAGGTFSPGANDNGSGLAVTLELARIFRVNDNVPTLIFVAFGSEEILEGYGKGHHHYGSRYMASHLSDLQGKVVGMISVDMVGVGSKILVNSTLAAPRVLAGMFMEHASANGIATEFRNDPGWSDHEAFENRGIPSFWVECREDPNYHTPRDTYDKIQPSLMNQMGHLLQGFLESIDEADCRNLSINSVFR